MSTITAETIQLMEMLPEDDQRMIMEMTRKFVLAWNPEYLGLTPNEETIAALKEAEDMEKHPENYKRYSSFRQFMEEMDHENE